STKYIWHEADIPTILPPFHKRRSTDLQFGFISSGGLYVAPMAAPTKPDGSGGSTTDGVTITVTAISTATPTVSGSAAVTVFPPKDRNSTRLNSSHLGISYAVFSSNNKR